MKEEAMNKLFASLTMIIMIAATATSVCARQKTVAGTWTFSIPEMSLRLVLVQKGKAVTGTLQHPHGGLIQLKGEFSVGQLKLSASSDGPQPLQ